MAFEDTLGGQRPQEGLLGQDGILAPLDLQRTRVVEVGMQNHPQEQ